MTNLAAKLAQYAVQVKSALQDLQQEEVFRYTVERLGQEVGSVSPQDFPDVGAQLIAYGVLLTEAERKLARVSTTEPLLPSQLKFLSDICQTPRIKDICADIKELLKTSPWKVSIESIVYFYENFLHFYDRESRTTKGVFYTPIEIAHYIVNTTDELLRTEFGLSLGIADPISWHDLSLRGVVSIPPNVNPNSAFVQIVDPAMGTGVFLLVAIKKIRDVMRQHWGRVSPVERKRKWQEYVRGTGDFDGRGLLQRMYGFDVMRTSVAIAQVNLEVLLKQDEMSCSFTPSDKFRFLGANTLALNPSSEKSNARTYEDVSFTVIIGNPPYRREGSNSKPSWVKTELLPAYTNKASVAGYGIHLKNCYNLYVYFWRWAEWKVHTHSGGQGVIAFVSASSFLRGPGFYGLRQHWRQHCAKIWITDFEGGQRGFRVTDNVFNIQTPVCVGHLLLRPEIAFSGRYFLVEGSKSEKLNFCLENRNVSSLSSLPIAPDGDTFVVAEQSEYQHFWTLQKLFPWQHSGVQFQRTWPIGVTKEVLLRRIEAFVSCHDVDRKRVLFKENRDRKIHLSYRNILNSKKQEIPLQEETLEGMESRIVRYGYRAFDMRYCIADARVCGYARPKLWQSHSPRQIYFAGVFSKPNVCGPALVPCTEVPDLDFLRSGGKDIIPMFIDNQARKVNLCATTHDALQRLYQMSFPPEYVYYYAFAILGNPSYVKKYESQMRFLPVSIPITNSAKLFLSGVKLGASLLRIQTFGQRLRKGTEPFLLQGKAHVVQHLPQTATDYPTAFHYDSSRQVIVALCGATPVDFIGDVSDVVWSFSVSGLQVISSWLKYRKKKSSGRKSSPLDQVTSTSWTQQMTTELLHVIWVLEMSHTKYVELDRWLEAILRHSLVDVGTL